MPVGQAEEDVVVDAELLDVLVGAEYLDVSVAAAFFLPGRRRDLALVDVAAVDLGLGLAILLSDTFTDEGTLPLSMYSLRKARAIETIAVMDATTAAFDRAVSMAKEVIKGTSVLA